MAGERAVVVPGDHAAALAVVNTWTESRPPLPVRTGDLLELVGMIAASRADARACGRREGLDSAADRLQLWAKTLRAVP